MCQRIYYNLPYRHEILIASVRYDIEHAFFGFCKDVVRILILRIALIAYLVVYLDKPSEYCLIGNDLGIIGNICRSKGGIYYIHHIIHVADFFRNIHFKKLGL